MQRPPVKVYVVMLTHDAQQKKKPTQVYPSAQRALAAFHEDNKLNAIRFDRYKLVEATCSDVTNLRDFEITKLHDYLPSYLAGGGGQFGLFESPSSVVHPERRLSPLEKLGQFLRLDIRKFHDNDKAFLQKLAEQLPDNFFTLSAKDQFNFIYDSRENTRFMNLLMSHWQLAVYFMDKVISGDAELLALRRSSQRLSMIHYLNNFRREIIPEDIRRRMPLELQQQHVMRVLQHRHEAKKGPPVEMPVMLEGLLTQKIGEADLTGNLEIPQELICPISGALFKEPVVVNQNGVDFYFEKAYILEALKQKKENPMNRQPLLVEDLKPAPHKVEEVIAFKAECAKKLGLEERAPQSSPSSPPFKR